MSTTVEETTDLRGPATALNEQRFYLGMAVLIALIVLASFGGNFIVGHSSFHAPWWVHVHAVTYLGWIVLYLLQNLLVVRGKVAQHRKIGVLMAAWMAWMVIVGLALLPASIAAHRSPPPIFTAPSLLAMDGITVLVFAGLILAGLVMRYRSDWHRRLMLAGTILIIAPAFGRMTDLLWGFSWRDIILLQLLMMVLAMAFDRANRGRVHPALIWGAGAITATGFIVPLVAALPFVAAYAASLVVS
jgi:FtsH-binding integral membrane protein